MAPIRAGNPFRSSRPDNLNSSERLVSTVAGLGLTLLAVRRGGFLGKLAMSSAGLSLLTRGATGYCAMKAAATGQAPLSQGLSEQWQRLRAGFGRGAASIDSLDSMYVAELQELHSAEAQLSALVENLADSIENVSLAAALRGYATELASRRQDLERILSSRGADPRQHPDQAMRALVNETWKMAQVCGASVRDAALVGSLQRLIHYKIASYGTVAAYGKALDCINDAARLAEYADRDKAMDAELSELAKATLNPAARLESRGHYASPTEPIRH